MNMKKEYGYAKKGERLMAERSGSRKGKRITVIGALENRNKLVAPFYFEGNTDTKVFNLWVEEVLMLELKDKGSKTIIMDNASFHKSERTKELIENAGHTLLYLPPYSPDFNPIEQKWGHVKEKVKSIKDNFKNFFDCLDYVLCL
jgi:transposase